jgi:hypothetical protein
MVYGPLRIILLVIFVFFLNRLVSLKSSNQTGLDYFMPRFLAFTSFIVLLAFFLIQLNAYDSFAILVTLFMFILLKFLNLNFRKPLKRQLFKIRARMILYTVRNLEQRKKLIGTENFQKKELRAKDTDQQQLSQSDYYWQLGLVIAIGVLTYASRYYFFHFDTFALSDLWYQDFSNIKDLYEQKWLLNDGVLMGEYVLIHLYAALTDISDVIALQTFGLLENAILGVVLFWTVSKMTNTKYIPGLIAAFVFMVFYAFIPLNINLITQHKPTFLALCLALPIFVFVCKPTTLRIKIKSYSWWMALFYIGISFIDVFTAFFIVPILLISALVTLERTTLKYYKRAVFAYGISLTVFLLVYGGASYVSGSNLWQFLQSNLYSFKAYTYVPQLIVPVDTLMGYYVLVSIVSLVVTILLHFIGKENKKHLVSLFLACLLIFTTPLLQVDVIDIDLLYQVISVFIPLLFGGVFYLMFLLLTKVIGAQHVPVYGKLLFVLIPLVVAYSFFQQKTLQDIPVRNLTNEYILEAYDALDAQLLPFSFTVVNTDLTWEVSKDSHFFSTYEYFNNNYEAADSIYVANRTNLAYLRENPDATLSKSTFVFIYHKNAHVNKSERLDMKEQEKALAVLNSLAAKGRTVRPFFEKPLLTVYEVVNEPNATKINDLLF